MTIRRSFTVGKKQGLLWQKKQLFVRRLFMFITLLCKTV